MRALCTLPQQFRDKVTVKPVLREHLQATWNLPETAESQAVADLKIAGAGIRARVKWINNVDAVRIGLVGNPVIVMVQAVIAGDAEAFREALLQRELQGVVNRIAARDTLGHHAEVGVGNIATIKSCIRVNVVRQVCSLRSHTVDPVNRVSELKRGPIDLPEMVGLDAPQAASYADADFRGRICRCRDRGANRIHSERSPRSRFPAFRS